MPKEIKILLPDFSTREFFDIHIQHSGNLIIPNYRFEIWDLEKDNPNKLEAAEFLRNKIESYAEKWQVAEIFAQEDKTIPILLKKIIKA